MVSNSNSCVGGGVTTSAVTGACIATAGTGVRCGVRQTVPSHCATLLTPSIRAPPEPFDACAAVRSKFKFQKHFQNQKCPQRPTQNVHNVLLPFGHNVLQIVHNGGEQFVHNVLYPFVHNVRGGGLTVTKPLSPPLWPCGSVVGYAPSWGIHAFLCQNYIMFVF